MRRSGYVMTTSTPRGASRPAVPTALRGGWRNYRFPLLIIAGVLTGAVAGLVLGERAAVLRPFGTVFINMMFTLVVPLVFFSISSAVAAMDSAKRLGRIMVAMMCVFIVTGIVASVLMIAALGVFSPLQSLTIELTDPGSTDSTGSIGDQIIRAITVDDFSGLLSAKSMLPLIIFAVLVGFAATGAGERGRPFRDLLASASEVFMRLTSIVMYYAPIGLGAYFAALIGQLGAQLVGGYARAFVVYFPVATVYFLGAFTLYGFISGGREGVRRFWRNILEPTAVAFGTGSSVASIPANLRAANRTGVPADISETIIPIGATIHMEGSCLSAILKIAFLFALFDQNLFTPRNVLIAVGVALLSGMVMSGIPSGGFIGEMMIVTLYGFPASSLPVISLIGTVIDAPATTINAVGDNSSSMLVARILDGRDWMARGRAANEAAGLLD